MHDLWSQKDTRSNWNADKLYAGEDLARNSTALEEGAPLQLVPGLLGGGRLPVPALLSRRPIDGDLWEVGQEIGRRRSGEDFPSFQQKEKL